MIKLSKGYVASIVDGLALLVRTNDESNNQEQHPSGRQRNKTDFEGATIVVIEASSKNEIKT